MRIRDALLPARSYLTILIGFLLGLRLSCGWKNRCPRA